MMGGYSGQSSGCHLWRTSDRSYQKILKQESILSLSGTLAFEVASLIVSHPGGDSPLARRLIVEVGAIGEGILQFADGLETGLMQSLHLILQGLIDTTHVFQVPLANLEVFSQLLIDIKDLIVLGDDEVDLCTGVLQLSLRSSCLHPLLFQLLTEGSPLLLLTGEKFNLLTDLVLHAFTLKFLRGDVELQLLAILFLVLQLALIDGHRRLQFGNAAVQFAVLVLQTGEGLIEIGLLPHQTADVALRLVALLADGFALDADACILPSSLLHLLPQLSQLQSGPLLLHFLHVSETLLLLEADAGFRDFIFLAVFVGDELLGGEFGLLEGLGPQSQFLLQVFGLQTQFADIPGRQLQSLLIACAFGLVVTQQCLLPCPIPAQLLLGTVIFLLVGAQRLHLVLKAGNH